jgi:Spy/CpxP family protein refolding chaperone
MKTNSVSLIAALTLGFLLCCSGFASAQTNTNATTRSARRVTVKQRVEQMATELKLTDDQKTKITTLLDNQSKKRRELRADTSLSRKDRRDQVRALMLDQSKQMKEILTPEQFEKWQKMRPEGQRPRGKKKAEQ